MKEGHKKPRPLGRGAVTEQEVLVFAIKRLDDQRQRIDELEHRLGINHFKAPVDPRDRVRA